MDDNELHHQLHMPCFQSSQPFFKPKLIAVASSFLHSEVSGSFDVDQDVEFYPLLVSKIDEKCPNQLQAMILGPW